MLLCFLLFGAALSVYSHSIQDIIDEEATDIGSIGEITIDNETFLMHVVPFGMMTKKLSKVHQLSDILNSGDENYRKFISYMEKGYTLKGLTFNIYDDNMREAAIVLFNMIRGIDQKNFRKVKEWAKQNINDHMFDYAERLCTLYGSHTYNFKWKTHEPPFLLKPNFYVNSETIMKALKLKSNGGRFNPHEAKVNQYYKTDNIFTINTNYSGWNEPEQGCEEKLDYFTEDISLNAYNYGLHLLHPFWMSNDELDEINPRQAEHFYFSHQQLLARYLLEKESMRQRNVSRSEDCDDYFNPNLLYDNGLPFPTRANIQGNWSEDKAILKEKDISMKEFITRGFFVMENGPNNLTPDNYIQVISKIIRGNYEQNIQTAKIVRSLYGYGKNGYPKDRYNPAPSLLHQPETALRDPAYWYLIQYMLNYFRNFQNTLVPFDISQYETNDIVIIDANFTKLTTFFDYYQFIIDKAMESDNEFPTISFAARQRRLNHLPITFDFNIYSKLEQDVIVRLFLGPQCLHHNCFYDYNKFYQLDAWSTMLEAGENFIRWTPDMSHKISSDSAFNKEDRSTRLDVDAYNIFKFPVNLLLPKGLEEGLNMTLFIIVTPQDDPRVTPITEGSSYYNVIYYEIDKKALGFPFHRRAISYSPFANNYKFYDITVFHKKRPVDNSGYFSPHLY